MDLPCRDDVVVAQYLDAARTDVRRKWSIRVGRSDDLSPSEIDPRGAGKLDGSAGKERSGCVGTQSSRIAHQSAGARSTRYSPFASPSN